MLVMSGRTGGWKGVFSVHSWVVLKPENGKSWRRYDVVGWGNPVRINGWAPGRPVVRQQAAGGARSARRRRRRIPKIEAAVKAYQYANAGDYRIWPGPNSNTFVATVLRAIPEAETTLPANAVGSDFRPFPMPG